MKKIRRVYAKWSSKDIKYLRASGIEMDKDAGFTSFDIVEESETYQELKKSFLLKKRKDFSDSQIAVDFTQEEIDACDYFEITGGATKGYPQPTDDFGYLGRTYGEYYKSSGIPKIGQPYPFILKGEPKWKKNEVMFGLIWAWDALFVKKEFFEQVLKPMGFKSREVHTNLKGRVAETAVQWDIPICSSPMCLEGSVYDLGDVCEESGIKKYTNQTLDYLPRFKEKVEQGICLSQEFFGEGYATRKIIVDRKMKDFFFGHKIIKWIGHLLPLRPHR